MVKWSLYNKVYNVNFALWCVFMHCFKNLQPEIILRINEEYLYQEKATWSIQRSVCATKHFEIALSYTLKVSERTSALNLTVFCLFYDKLLIT